MAGFENLRVFITGGANGIGKCTTLKLLERGAKVFVFDVSEELIKALESESKSDNLVCFQGDIRNEEDVVNSFQKCKDAFGGVDALLNGAGIGIPSPDLSDTDIDVFEKMVDINMKGVFLASREALKSMKPQGKGHIMTLISMAGQRTNPGAPLYCASKFGARGLSSGLADQMLKAGIKVTDINPGPVNSAYWGDRDVPRDKFLSVEDVADVILFILSTPEHVVVREINFDNMKWLAK
jgi:NADP-dependent 3-hydroxy acid dehydrogenase YdfG